jgi:mRNA interferase RelE/StbE
MAATNALKDSAERIPYQKARRDLDLWLSYRLVLTRAARKDLDRLPGEVVGLADTTILALADQPRPFGSEKLQGFENLYRIRVGKYRILYEIDKATSIVTIARIAHRKSVYRKR